jgi:hypothetical protein
MAQVINGQALNNAEGFDKITSTDKITAGYFTDGIGKMIHSQITSASLQATQENYYFGIAKGNETGSLQFHVTYGNSSGYGADTDNGTVKSETEAIYKEWANILLAPTEVTGGFKISSGGSTNTANGKDNSIFVLSAQRNLMKDRLNKKNWTLILSGSSSNVMSASNSASEGSNPYHEGEKILHLTDDSANVAATATPAGPRYNIVSGSAGSVTVDASTTTYGWFYPDQGVMVFSGAELSASIPGSGSQVDSTTVFGGVGTGAGTAELRADSFRGFATTTNVDKNYHQALRFINTLQPNGSYVQLRNEEDQTSVSYFCRARAAHFNFSNNPTFVSGSQNEIRNESMQGNPQSFITGVELYDNSGNMVATGKLSTPLKKNFSSEATIKVKLTF